MILTSRKTFYTGRWLGVLVVSIIVVFMVVLPPFLSFEWRFLIMNAFSSICHQLPERSFHIHDVSFAVCHRCTGIYMGIVVGSMVLTLIAQTVLKRDFLVIATFLAIAIMGIDWLLPILEIGNNSMESRVVSGFLFGVAAGGLLGQSVAHKQGGDENPEIDIPESNFVY